jgi:hypothetical protein
VVPAGFVLTGASSPAGSDAISFISFSGFPNSLVKKLMRGPFGLQMAIRDNQCL